MTGNPTPYFLTVCKPNYSSLSTSCEQNPYVMEDICTGGDQAAISQGRSGLCSSVAFVRTQEPEDMHTHTYTQTHTCCKETHALSQLQSQEKEGKQRLAGGESEVGHGAGVGVQ